MGILGIENRTENWKTARHFAPFFKSASARAALANRLLRPYEESESDAVKAVKMELYWKGMRDYIHELDKNKKPTTQDFQKRYVRLFPDLRDRICEFNIQKFNDLRLPKPCNYDVSTESRMQSLRNNLRNTEIDIVLQTPRHLFIGEAKDESGFGADESLVLVHQLVRQYVMARILVDLIPGATNTCVVPFIVGHPDKLASMTKTNQVRFMCGKGWLRRENVMSWDEIAGIAKAGAVSG